jgi:hypothetical protein
METDATQEGALTETPEKEERQLSRREQMMVQLEEKTEAQLYEESGITPDKSEPAPEPEPKAEPAHEEDAVVKVKIDGEEKEIPLSELKKGYQKDATASKRLEEVAREKAQLAAERAAFEAERKAQLEKQSIAVQADPTPVDDGVDAALDNFVEGDKDQMRELLRRALKERAPQDPTPIPHEELDRLVEERLSIREEAREHAGAQAAFKKDYSDIFTDPDLLAAANRRYYAKIDEGKSITDAMAEAGKETKEWMQAKTGSTQISDKQKRKENIDNLPTAGARASATPTDETAENTSKIIADMRKARGLPD